MVWKNAVPATIGGATMWRKLTLVLAILGASVFVGMAQPAGAQTCKAEYVQCLEVTDDLDCPDIIGQVTLRDVNNDPYRLDADNDGIGCESGDPAVTLSMTGFNGDLGVGGTILLGIGAAWVFASRRPEPAIEN